MRGKDSSLGGSECVSLYKCYKYCPEQIVKIIDKCDNGTRDMRDNTKFRGNRSNTELGRTAFKHRSALQTYEKFKNSWAFHPQ